MCVAQHFSSFHRWIAGNQKGTSDRAAYQNDTVYWSGAERSSPTVNLDFRASLSFRGGGYKMWKMIAFVLQLHRGEAEGSVLIYRGNRDFCCDGSRWLTVRGARVPRTGSARCGLFDCRLFCCLAGSSAGQAETTPRISSRSFSDPGDREHYVSCHRTARLPQETEWSSRTGKAWADNVF